MKIQIYQPLSIHEVGKRDNQEDALWREGATIDDRLFIVCDGMGGHSNSEIASQTFSQALGRWFAENANPNEKLSNEELDDLLQRAIDYAYQKLDKQDDGSFKKMGTTLTLLYIHAQGVLAAHIGDSRIYHIRPSERILYQSKDHSLVYDLYQAGEISYEEMATHPQKNVITKAVTPGEENRATPDIIHITDIKAGDYFYMCSDGMLERMSNGELFELFAAPSSDETKRQQLIHATEDNADNHTAWIIHVESVLSEAGDPIGNEEETARCNALNIRPAKPEEEAIEIADDSDVKVVGMARTRTPQGRPQGQHGK
ncbi:MAG: serine/threonine-protein phosphatase, partial [Prevotella sp.]|nr:serine/threonine-protein phosphatase [Prevotella sp.]